MKKVKNLLTFLAIMFSIAILKGQDYMLIHLADENDIVVETSDIQRITFNSDNMLLKTVNGTENSYLLDNIACITFVDDPPSVIHEPHYTTENIEINVYINSSGDIVVESPYPIQNLTVFDINGRTIKTSNRNDINVNSLSMGIYLLKVETSKTTVTKKFIKNR